MMYLIWNNERRMWWKPCCIGYTENRRDAGSYTRDEALNIMRDNEAEKKPHKQDVMVPEDESEKYHNEHAIP